MKRLQRYVLVNVFKAFVPAFTALVLLMAVGVCLQLLNEGLDVVRVASLVRLVLAYSVPMVLPSAFLTAVILTFGRLAGDNELTAVRAAGIPMFRAVHPVLWAACGLAVLAAYFQFETVPRSQGALRALKYKAFKQILLDKAALSWSRQFSFPPVHIMYDDFRDGVMHNVVVLHAGPRRVEQITTARTATIEDDAVRPERIVFRMNDCVITDSESQKGGMPRSAQATPILYWVKAVTSSEDVLSRRRYFPLMELISDMRLLKAAVAGHPARRDADIESARKDRRRKLRLLQGETADHHTVVESKRKDYDKATLRAHEHRKTEELAEAAILDAGRVLDELQVQMNDCRRELEAAPDVERMMQLQQRQADIVHRITAARESIGDAEARRDQARRDQAQSARTVGQLEREIAILNERSRQLMAGQAEIRRQLRIVEDQDNLRDVEIRIHKRLSQAVSVLTFALLGIPLGVTGGRRNVMVAFGLSFAIVLLVFYPLLILGEVAAEAGKLPIVPAIWGGNVLTLGIGLVLSLKTLSR